MFYIKGVNSNKFIDDNELIEKTSTIQINRESGGEFWECLLEFLS